MASMRRCSRPARRRHLLQPGSSLALLLALQPGVFGIETACNKDRVGSCLLFGCASSLGSTVCSGHSCICSEGYCNDYRGVCRPQNETLDACPIATGGSCNVFGCSATRGETECVNGNCVCKEGFCNNRGACRREGGEDEQQDELPQCLAKTDGTCRIFGCRAWRGATMCQGSTCVCKPGYCVEDGVCRPDAGTLRARVAPVTQDSPNFPGYHGKVTTALVFSGGGARSMTVSFGALRGLALLGLLDKVDLLSSVSGGSWAASVYMFVDKPMEELLGKATDPSKLTMEVLGQKPAALGNAATVESAPILSRLYYVNNIPLPMLWIKGISEAILGNFGLDDLGALMAASEEDVKRIKELNPSLQDRTFFTPAPGRPKAFVMSGSILAPTGYEAAWQNVVSLQMSPDYTGSPFYPNDTYVAYDSEKGKGFEPLQEAILGGGFVESFAFGGQAPDYGQDGGEAVRMASPIEPMSLAKAVGVSSAGPASAFTQTAGIADMTYLNPLSNVWPVTSKRLPGPQRAMTHMLGDGGNVDNSGVLAALQRGAKRVLWLINTEVPLLKDVDFCTMGSVEDIAKYSAKLEFQFQSNFGFYKRNQMIGQFLSNNHVFASEELAPLMCDLKKLLDAGKPTIVRRELRVLANPWWGIRSYDVSVTFMYSEKCQNFEDMLPEDTKKEISWGAVGKLANYPHYDVVFQNVGETTALLPEQVNLLAAQTEYSVLQNEALLREFFAPGGAAAAANLAAAAAAAPATGTAPGAATTAAAAATAAGTVAAAALLIAVVRRHFRASRTLAQPLLD